MNANVPIEEWLVLTGKGQAQNYSTSVAAGAVYNDTIQNTSDYMMLYAVQFDGVMSGQVTYELRGGGSSVLAGYAVNGYLLGKKLLCERGQGCRLQVNNRSGSVCVMNVDYIVIQSSVWEREVLQHLVAHVPGGR